MAEMSGQLAFDIDSDGTVSREEAKVPCERWRKITITRISLMFLQACFVCSFVLHHSHTVVYTFISKLPIELSLF